MAQQPRDDFQPEDDFIAEDDFQPEPIETVVEPTVTPDEPGMVGRVWETLTTPLWNTPAEKGTEFAEYMTEPELDTSRFEAQIKGFLGGAGEGVGNLISGFTSPLELGMLATGLGAGAAARRGASGTARALSGAERALSGAEVVSGGETALHGLQEGDIGQIGLGVAEMAAGGAGMTIPGPNISRQTPDIPKVADDIIPPIRPEPDVDAPGSFLELSDDALPTPEPSTTGTFTEGDLIVPDQDPMTSVLPEAVNPGIIEARANREAAEAAMESMVPDRYKRNSDPTTVLEEAPTETTQAEIDTMNPAQRTVQAVDEAAEVSQMSPAQRALHEKAEKARARRERMRLKQNDVDGLMQKVLESDLDSNRRVLAYEGVRKIVDGEELDQLQGEALAEVFGDDFVSAITNHMQLVNRKHATVAAEVLNLPRGIMATADFSAPFRQGLGLAHRGEFWGAFPDMFRAAGSEDTFRAIQNTIEADDFFDIADASGLSLTDLTDLRNREERIMSTWAERIPGFGRVTRGSNRAYVTFLNKVRMDTFNSMAKAVGDELTPDLAKEMAEYVNNATGRGSLGKLESSAVALNSTLFSPRLLASRVNMLRPDTYIRASPEVRKEYLKSMATIIGAGSTFVGAGVAAGGETSFDPTTSDFMKLRFGDTRVDPFGGFQQYIVALSRIARYAKDFAAEQTGLDPLALEDYAGHGGPFGQPTAVDTLGRFFRYKEHPALSALHDIATGRDAIGRKVEMPDVIKNRFMPIIMQDFVELYNEDPELLLLMVPATLGVGVQTHTTGRSSGPTVQ